MSDALLRLAAELSRSAAGLPPARDPELTWVEIYEIPDGCLPRDWRLFVGYSVDWEPGDAPDVWIHEGELQTGRQVIRLTRDELPTKDLEPVLSEQIEDEARAACYDLAHPDSTKDEF